MYFISSVPTVFYLFLNKHIADSKREKKDSSILRAEIKAPHNINKKKI